MQRSTCLAAGAALIILLLLSGASYPAEAHPLPAQQLRGAAARQFLAREGILAQLAGDAQPSTPAQGRSFMEPQPLTPSDGAAGDALGLAVAMEEDTLVVSAHRADGPGGVDQGAVYIFSRLPGPDGSAWNEEQKLTAGDAAEFDLFGSALALDGDTLLVGALDADISGNVDQGAAYVFNREGDVWSEVQKLTAGDGAAGDEFSFSVALDEETALIGAYRADIAGDENLGAAYVFTREGAIWVEQQKLTAGDGAPLDHFGFAVALDGEVAIAGAPDAEVDGENEQGAAYLFSYDGDSWSEQYKLTASDGAAGDQFGVSLALQGESALVGAFAAEIDGKEIQGAVYHFASDEDGAWSERQKLTAGDGVANDYFGFGLAVDGDTLVVCAYGVDVDGNIYQGAAYLFARSDIDGLWRERQKFVAADGEDSDFFGISAALDRDIAVVGAYWADAGGLVDAGKVYVMERGPMPWPETSVNEASDGAAGDNLGVSVALERDTAVIGAYHHQLAGNPNQGTAYVFVRNGSIWVQQQKLVAGDGREGDYFGASAALDGDTMVVGAFRADIAGNSQQGAAYVFTRAGSGIWSEQQKLTAGDGQAGDQFGASVDLQGDTIVVGAARADLAGNVDQGAVYSFTRSSESGGDAWSEGQKLVAEDGVAESLFGRSVALGLNMLLAGAPGSEIGASLEQGAVYVFARDGNVGPWNEQQKLLAEDGAAGDTFGEAVAVAGNWAGVGAYLADIGDTADQGAAYIFARAGGVWGERQKLVAGDGATGDYFGFSVALDGNRAVIGAVLADIGGRIDRGAAYVYAVDGASWWWEQKLPAGESVADNSSSSGAYDYFGFSSALDGDTALVGAIWAGVAGDEGAGQAHFFSREQGYFGLYLPMGWNQ